MNTPEPISTPILRLSDATRKECALVAKQTSSGLTEEEKDALRQIYEEQDRAAETANDQELDAWVDAQEARVRSRDFPVNFHE